MFTSLSQMVLDAQIRAENARLSRGPHDRSLITYPRATKAQGPSAPKYRDLW